MNRDHADCIFVVSNHITSITLPLGNAIADFGPWIPRSTSPLRRSPSGRVGPSGQERAIRFARNHAYQSQNSPIRPLTCPTSSRGGEFWKCRYF